MVFSMPLCETERDEKDDERTIDGIWDAYESSEEPELLDQQWLIVLRHFHGRGPSRELELGSWPCTQTERRLGPPDRLFPLL